MKNLNIKAFVYIFLGISAALWLGIAIATGVDLSKVWDFVKILPKVAAIDILIVGIFVKWGWRWKRLQGWLVPFPDLNGTWQGTIQTTWKNKETGETPGPIPTILSIKQSFTQMSCVMRTEEMQSHSYIEGFKLDKDAQIRQLAYSYTSKPRPTVTERSAPHDGAIVIDIMGKPVDKLKGRYWTERKTTGEISLTFREKDLLDDFPSDLGEHPMSEAKKEEDASNGG